MGPELLGALATIIVGTVAGLGWLQDKSNKRIDSILDRGNARIDLVLLHVQKVETTLYDMRADMPLTYTLREDHIRLEERVEKLSETVKFWQSKVL